MNVFIYTITKLRKSKSPIKYWRKFGAKIGEVCEIYSFDFASEPYLITIGNHVRIT